MAKENKTPDVPAGSSNPPVKPKFRDRMRERYPQENFDEYDDDRWDDLENRYMDETDESLGKYKESEQVMNDLIKSDEDLAMVMHEMIVNKKPFRAAIATFLSQEDLVPQPEDEDYDAYQKAYAERLERGKKRLEIKDEIDANEKATMETIDSYAKEKGLSDDEKGAFIDGINNLFNDLVMKRITPENVDMLYKAINYDSAVAAAEAKGEIAGRNANIKAMKADMDARQRGDGLPNMGGGGNSPEVSEAPKQGLFSQLPNRNRI